MATAPDPNLTLTDEEKSVLEKTKREALMYRCIPLGAVSGLMTFSAFRRGFMANRSLVAKIFFAGSLQAGSFFFGVISYSGEFRRKIMELENSPLKDRILNSQNNNANRSPYQTNSSNRHQRNDYQQFPSNESQSRGPHDSYGSFFNNRTNQPATYGGRHDNFSPQSRPISSNDRFDIPENNDYRDNLTDNPMSPSDQEMSFNTQSSNNKKYMTYAERRQFYRNSPVERGQIDPFSKSDKPQQIPSNTSPLNPAQSNTESQYNADKPFVPFFNEMTHRYSDDEK